MSVQTKTAHNTVNKKSVSLVGVQLGSSKYCAIFDNEMLNV